MTGGVIQGGWDYVIAAYSISWAALIAYGVSLYIRAKRAPQP
jgi:hypothetical protein